MNELSEKVPLQTWLDAEQAAAFDMIQRHYGLSNRSEVVRLLIRQAALRITAEQAQPAMANHQAPCA